MKSMNLSLTHFAPNLTHFAPNLTHFVPPRNNLYNCRFAEDMKTHKYINHVIHAPSSLNFLNFFFILSNKLNFCDLQFLNSYCQKQWTEPGEWEWVLPLWPNKGVQLV